mmetsp:Transcript_15420/g.36391  ORF Transcript_15420/g.36391 Transcript_15420/m.36391 type:complete len:175 (-) Transcript_15420:116-640(-)
MSSKIGYLGYLGLLPCLAAACWLGLGVLRRTACRDLADRADEQSSGDDNVEPAHGAPNPWQAFMGAPREGEMRRLLFYVEQGPLEALPPLPEDYDEALPNPAQQRPLAEAEVERILTPGQHRELFAARDVAGRDREFRRLVRLLHPDSGLVPRERSMLALRRLVEAYRAAAPDA